MTDQKSRWVGRASRVPPTPHRRNPMSRPLPAFAAALLFAVAFFCGNNETSCAADNAGNTQAGPAKEQAAKTIPPFRGQNIKVLCKCNDKGSLVNVWLVVATGRMEETLKAEGRSDQNSFDLAYDSDILSDPDFEFLLHLDAWGNLISLKMSGRKHGFVHEFKINKTYGPNTKASEPKEDVKNLSREIYGWFHNGWTPSKAAP